MTFPSDGFIVSCGCPSVMSGMGCYAIQYDRDAHEVRESGDKCDCSCHEDNEPGGEDLCAGCGFLAWEHARNEFTGELRCPNDEHRAALELKRAE